MKKKFISKRGEWFDEGTEAKLISEEFNYNKENQFDLCNLWGLFSGIRNGKPDEEACSFDEFDIILTEE